MTGAMVSASTGVMSSVIGKLTTLLSAEYQLVKSVKSGIRFLRDELSSMNAVLQRLADIEDDPDRLDPQTKEWRNKVRELSYDIEDCIDRFMLGHSHGDAKANILRNAVSKMKKLWKDRRIAKEIQEFKSLVNEVSERRKRYVDQSLMALPQPVLLDPRAPTLYEQARNPVGIDAQREEIINLIKAEEAQLKVVAIFGIGGLGKTTLATEVYHKIEEPFECRASVSVSRAPDLKKLLRDIFFQVNKSEFDQSERWETENLIQSLREYLTDKRYLIVVDDMWTTSAWEHVKSALPPNIN